MKFLAHRGLWSSQNEKNSFLALCRGLDAGFGLETDIRDLNGQLVISHDMPTINRALPLEKLLQYYADGGFSSKLALNIKSDGLQIKLLKKLKDYGIKNYFVFDMSVPDTIDYLQLGIMTYIRRSDVESYPKLELLADGLWLDEMSEIWIDADAIIEAVKQKDAVCIVSGELHGRKHIPQWTAIRDVLHSEELSRRLYLCTDFPIEAERFFG